MMANSKDSNKFLQNNSDLTDLFWDERYKKYGTFY
jgi:hypothetical protein